MIVIRNFTLVLLLLSCAASAGFAQERPVAPPSSPSGMTVTISTSAKGIRVAALGGVRQMRLEVLGAGGDSLYSSGLQPGSVRDWDLMDAHGQRLPDGSYQCLVTFRVLSGRVGTKQGTVLIQDGQPSLQLSEAEQPGPVEPEKRLSPVTSDDAPAVTLTAHDGTDGQLVSTSGALAFRAGDFFSGRDQELMRLTPEGNLGIGTSAPQAKLDVAGMIRARGGIQFDDGTVLTSAARTSEASPSAPSPAGTTDAFTSSIAGTGSANQLAKWLDSEGTLANSSVTEVGGNVGFGTPAPAFPLDVNGTANVRSNLLVNGASQLIDTGNKFSLRGDPSYTTKAGYMTFTSGDDLVTGYMGVVAGNHPSPGAFVGTFTNHKFNFRTNNLDRVTIDQQGNVGVGTTTPGKRLEVNGSIYAGNSLSLGKGVNNYAGVGFNRDVETGAILDPSHFAYQITREASGNRLMFGVFNGAGSLIGFPLSINPDGQVDVSRNGPGTALNVTGDVNVSGNIAAKYQDVAEWVPARREIAAGTVVVMDASRSNGVKPSTRAYDTRVAGVVSARPGVLLGEAGVGKVMVATTGRVKVRVDARRRPVRVGDLLVTSGREGMAMRSVPIRAGRARLHRPGTIVGKALEPLTKGEGEILVLLSLQ